MSQPWTSNDIPDQTGRTWVVTGANSGLGLESTKALARKGALVVMACRDPGRAQAAEDEVRRVAPDGRLERRPLDLASLKSVEAFAADIAAAHPVLDGLLNNAGIMAIPRRLTADGFEMQLGTNHLGHFALTLRLLPLLEKAAAPRVVNVSSSAHRMGKLQLDDLMGLRSYSPWGAYGQSKLCNLLFTYELHRRLRASGRKTLTAAAHPGYAATNLQGVAPRMTGSRLGAWAMDVGNRLFAQPQDMGALPQLYAATAPDVEGGAFYGPDGFMEVKGHPRRVQSNGRSHNTADARALWEASEKLTGVTLA